MSKRLAFGRAVLTLFVLALFALALAACGSSSDNTSSQSSAGGTSEEAANSTSAEPASDGVAEAKQLVAEQTKQIKIDPPGEPFDATKASGKTIWYVSVGLSIPFEQFITQGLEEAADAVGAKVVTFDGKGSTSEEARGIQQGIRSGADVIIASGFPPSVVKPALEEAKAAGIPVITADSQDPGPLVPGTPPAVVANATHSFSEPGKMLADSIVADSEGDANTIFLSTPDIGLGNTLEEEAFKEEYERLCPECELKIEPVPIAQWSSLTTKTASMLRANPDVNYLAPGFDGMVTFMLPAIQSSGATDVQIASFNATPSVMTELKNGNVVFADAGGPNLIQGWAFGDQAFRVLAGVEPLEDLGIKDRMFDASNIDSLDLEAQESTWYTDQDYAAIYEELWGVGGK